MNYEVQYLQKYAGFPVYTDSETTYLSPGESKHDILLEQLRKAQHYIFLEYFIIKEGYIVSEFRAEEIKRTQDAIYTVGFGDAESYMAFKEKNNIQDYFTLLPGDKDKAIFEHLQGEIRYKEYIESFKFCDYQVIQMANLSPATFGYEKDAY